MESLWVLINRTSFNWNIYMGKKSLQTFKVFLNGAVNFCSIKKGMELEILPGFGEYVKETLGEIEESDLFDMIAKHSLDDGQAFERFFKMMYVFLEEQGEEYKPIREKQRV